MTKRLLQFQRRGDFHEAYGETAEIVARELGLTLTARDGVPMVGIPAHRMHADTTALCNAGFMVEPDAPESFFSKQAPGGDTK